MEYRVKAPVVLTVFRRPATVAKVFQQIRKVKPSQLFIIADGPRKDIPGEADLCQQALAVVDKVDWDCQVHRNCSDINLGPRRRLVSGFSWVFEEVEKAIILEEDCLPHWTFFRYCDELLDRYATDTRVSTISGDNFIGSSYDKTDSYYFSAYTCLWGWATWRRAWAYYDPTLASWQELRKTNWLRKRLSNDEAYEYWRIAFDSIYRLGEMFDNWDLQWTFASWLQNGLCVTPNCNLVSNIGFGPDANSGVMETPLGNIPVQAMEFPLRHPTTLAPDIEADIYLQRFAYGPPPPIDLKQRVKNAIYDVMPVQVWRYLYRKYHRLSQ